MAKILKNLKRKILLPSKYWIFVLSCMVMSHPTMARDLESIANNLSTKTNTIATFLVPFGFAISAILMAVGHPRGAQFMSTTLMAALITLGGGSLFSWLKGVVG
jgi:cytochrome bd-type quinol oxidase subunit 2